MRKEHTIRIDKELLKQVCKEKNLTFKEIAQKMDYTPQHLSRAVNSGAVPFDLLARIGLVLNVDPYFFTAEKPADINELLKISKKYGGDNAPSMGLRFSAISMRRTAAYFGQQDNDGNYYPSPSDLAQKSKEFKHTPYQYYMDDLFFGLGLDLAYTDEFFKKYGKELYANLVAYISDFMVTTVKQEHPEYITHPSGLTLMLEQLYQDKPEVMKEMFSRLSE